MKCFGDKSKTFHCKVVLLDEQELIQEVQETTTGQDLLDVVYQHLNLIETAYFGLRFIDPSNQTHWLDPSKRLSKQLKGTSPYTLYFSVKFYAADPTKLVEEITRYQFFLQTKQDILQGRLPISTELVSELGSFAVQSELGDYDPRRHSPGYVSEFRFVTNQTVDLENKIAELHKKLLGYVPSKAELCYLEKVKWLDMYGVDLHSVLGEDSTEYFLGLTPSGIIVLRNKVKVGNYFWPRITKVYFRGRFFMLRVKDKNNSENTYGFETPSKSACKHLWQCCVEHHAFFRLTQAAGTSPQAIFSLGSKYSGRTEKEAVVDAKINARPQTEFARTPSRRYQRRIVEGAQDTPRLDDADHKPETRTIVSLPGTVTPVSSHVYRSTSLTLAPRSDSPRSIRSAPHPSGLQHKGGSVYSGTSTTRREGRPSVRDESPRSVKSTPNGRVPDGIERRARRTSSVESQSSVDSRSCNRSCSRHRRSRCRSSDGESEASSKCSSSKGHRRHHHKHNHHRHRNHSDDSSDPHKRRHRRHRHRSSEKPEPQLVESSGQWAKVQSGETPAKCNTATVRDLTSGYMPSGHEDTELDNSVHHHSSRRKHRKHRSRSRSPSEGKHKGYPEEIRRHIDFGLQNTEGLTEAQLKEIPYTKVETAKTVKIRYGSPKGKRHKSPKRSKSNSSDRKSQQPNERTEENSSPHLKGTYDQNYKDAPVNGTNGGTLERLRNGKIQNENEFRNENGNSFVNGNVRPCPRSSQGLVGLITSRESSPRDERVASLRSSPQRDSSPLRTFQEGGILQRSRMEGPQSSPLCNYGPKSGVVNGQGRSITPSGSNRSLYSNRTSFTRDQNPHHINNISNYSSISENTQSQFPHHHNPHLGGVFLPPLHDSGHTPEEEDGEMSSGFVDSNSGGFMNHSPILIKNATLERGSHFTSALKPQPSPQSSVTSGISIGSSSVSISNDSSLTRSSRSFQPSNNEYPSPSQSQDLSPPSSSPDPEVTPYYDKHITPTPRNKNRENGEPFYMNSRNTHCPVHSHSSSHSKASGDHNHYANNRVTQHSTNILIQYHDGNSSGASSGYKTPTPTPRSSVISSIHSPDSSTHIVQSYGPAYANSQIVNSLKRPPHLPTSSRPSSSLSTNSQRTLIVSSRDVISPNNPTSARDTPNYSSLPRKPLSKPFKRSTGSQTNLTTNDESQYDEEADKAFSIKDKIAFHEKKTKVSLSIDTLNNLSRTETFDSTSDISKPRSALCSSRNGLMIRDQNESVNSWQRDTNPPSDSHWKVYNWDTGRNEDNWSNSLSRNNHPQDQYNGQRSGDGGQFTRRGSAGSLDLILSPLIQSALEHQQR